MSELRIREMNEKDLLGVQRLVGQLNEVFKTDHEISLRAIRSTFRVMIKEQHKYINFIALLDERLVGFVSAAIYKTFFHSHGTLLINELVVDTAERGKGIGGKLLQTLLEIARSDQMNQIEVETSTDNQKAIEFYKKYGLVDESLVLGKEIRK
jgi:ribosomal protein S18 acetylase RimI-like enzyme